MNDRRYREEEVREIFKLATSERVASTPAAPASDGLTLAEIQSIGEEVGVGADVIARAAATLDSSESRYIRKSFGSPVAVGLAVPLPRAMSDHEWEQVVALLRSTFGARGDLSGHGALREWRNGNLFASHEPSGNGYRLRLGTVRGDAAGVNALGIGGMIGSAVMGVTQIATSYPGPLLAPVLLGAFGIGAFLTNFLRLPSWARKREAQMKHVAATAKAIMT